MRVRNDGQSGKAAGGARRAGFVIRCAVACRFLRLSLSSSLFRGPYLDI